MWVMIMAPSSPTFSTCVCEMINRNLKRKRHEHFIALIADIWDCVNLRIRHYRRILRSVKLDRPKSRAIQFLSFQIPVITLTATRTPPCHPPRSSRTPLQDRDGRPTPPSPREQRFRQHRGWDSRTPRSRCRGTPPSCSRSRWRPQASCGSTPRASPAHHADRPDKLVRPCGSRTWLAT